MVHEVTGVIRWLDATGPRIVVHVDEAGSHAGGSLGQDITYDLGHARIATEDVDGDGGRSVDDLLPGVRVRVRTRMARSAAHKLPELLAATSVVAVPAAAA